MKDKLYVIIDRKANLAVNLFHARNDDVSMRSLAHALDRDSLICDHPEDFDLICVGEIDLESGVIVAHPVMTVCHITDIFRKDK